MQTNLTQKQFLLLAVIGIPFVVLILWSISFFYSEWNEGYLLKKYAANPERKIFAEWIGRDKKALNDKNLPLGQRVGATMDVGLQWYNLMEWGLAAKWWEKGLDIEANNTIGWYNLGNAYRELKKYRAAEKAYRKSMKLARPDETEACLGLAEMYNYAYLEKKNKTDNVLLECLKKHPNDRDLIAKLAIYYRDSDNKKKAVEYFDKLFSIEPTQDVAEELRKLRLNN